MQGRPRHALTRALGKAIHLYGSPCCNFLAVIDGMEMGRTNRYSGTRDRSKVHPAAVMLGVYRGLLDGAARARLAEP